MILQLQAPGRPRLQDHRHRSRSVAGCFAGRGCYGPDVAAPVEMSCTRTYPVTVERAFDVVLPYPLERVFDRRYAAIPSIRATEQDGVWGEVGQIRTVLLTGGGSMREQLTSVERPSAFSYRLTDVTGPMKALADHIDGTWSFTPAGTGARITWHWTLYPKSAVVAAALPLFVRMWNGYARLALAHIEELLVPN
jgi:hypothetical protein